MFPPLGGPLHETLMRSRSTRPISHPRRLWAHSELLKKGKDWKHDKQENAARARVCVCARERDDGVCQGESTSILTYFCHSDYELIC